MARPVPPKIAPKPGKVTVLRALYPYTAQQEDELSFSEGDVLYLVDQSCPDWWKARCGRNAGLIPSNYVETKMDSLENPVHDAARRGNLEFLKECLSNGVSPTGLDTSGSSPIHWSARGGHLECLQEILRAASKQFNNTKQFINVQNKLGDTPLHLAACKDHEEIVNILLDNDANPLLRNKEGQTPFDLCHEHSIKKTLKNWVYVPGVDEDGFGEGEYLEDSDEGDLEEDSVSVL